MPYVGSTVSLLTLMLALAQAADEIQSKTFISLPGMANVQFVDGLILESQAKYRGLPEDVFYSDMLQSFHVRCI